MAVAVARVGLEGEVVAERVELAEEEERYNLDDIAKGICDKLVRRHPHVYGGGEARDTSEVLNRWEEIKREEKALAARQKDEAAWEASRKRKRDTGTVTPSDTAPDAATEALADDNNGEQLMQCKLTSSTTFLGRAQRTQKYAVQRRSGLSDRRL